MSPSLWFSSAPRLVASELFSTTDADARAIALGLVQIRSLPSGAWNDPTAPGLGRREKAALIEQWGVGTRVEWLSMVEYLSTVRRRRHAWMLHLAVRNDLATAAGRAPTATQWLAAIAAEGGDARDARPFVDGIVHIEREVRDRVGADVITPELFVRTLDGYALGQAVAMTTWGVALGHADVAEARGIIRRIHADARHSFVSWADFGLSYVAGRIMHWSDGDVDEKAFEKFGDGWADVRAATRRGAPWATLSWDAPVDAQPPTRRSG